MRARAAGGIEAVLKAIDAQIDSVDVCNQACGALNNLTTYGKTNNNKGMNN